MQRDWERHWRDAGLADKDLRRQVGRTVQGQPTTDEELAVLIDDTRRLLTPGRRHLDLCCGNGLLTVQIKICAEVVGVDYSPSLLEIARKCFGTATYIEGSINCIGELLARQAPFDRVSMLESFQYFTASEVDHWLPKLLERCTTDVRIALLGIPDARLFHRFADSEERRADMERRRREEGDPIGTWWDRDELVQLGRRHGVQVSIHAPAPRLNTAHYRFDALLVRG